MANLGLLHCRYVLPAIYYLADGDNPILILVDVFSELDQSRRERLAKLTESTEQTFITVAVANDLPEDLTGTKYSVAAGVVK